MPKELFGTDGIRGIPGTPPLDDRTLSSVGRALGESLARAAAAPRVLIGMDTRESGPHIAAELASGLAAGGATPVFAGIMTTPGVACLVRLEGFAAGVVISASHNPYHDNGVKLIAGTGMKFPDEFEEALEADILRHREGVAPDAVRMPAETSFEEDYLAFLRGRMIPGAKLAGLKIVLDCANGAASRLAPALFRSLGAEVSVLHDRPDGRNINAGCGSQHTADLRRAVVEHGAALGAAFDGDADRAVFSCAKGKEVNGDGVLLAMAHYLRSKGQLKGKRIIGTTMANLGLERALERDGLTLARVAVGDRYVLEEMLRSGANLGGEQSGHVIFLDDATTGDGLLTALKMACLVSLCGPLDALVADLKIFPQAIKNVKVRAKPPLESIPDVSRTLAEAEKALGNSGRIVLRYSGTEPLARVMVEAERAEDVERWTGALVRVIQNALGA